MKMNYTAVIECEQRPRPNEPLCGETAMHTMPCVTTPLTAKNQAEAHFTKLGWVFLPVITCPKCAHRLRGECSPIQPSTDVPTYKSRYELFQSVNIPLNVLRRRVHWLGKAYGYSLSRAMISHIYAMQEQTPTCELITDTFVEQLVSEFGIRKK